jgi:hypothetical protein
MKNQPVMFFVFEQVGIPGSGSFARKKASSNLFCIHGHDRRSIRRAATAMAPLK